VLVATFSAAHRWVVIALWFVATIGIFLVSLAAGGTDAENAVSDDTAPEYESGRAYDVFNARGASDDPSQDLIIVVSTGAGTVDDKTTAAAVTDIVARATALTSTVGGAEVPTFDRVIDPLTAPPEAGLVSPDRTTVRAGARIPRLAARGTSGLADPRPQRHARQRRHRDAGQRGPR
jgi:hypothetical protein